MNHETTETKKEERRSFLMKIGLGMGGLAALVVSIPVIGALIQPLLEKKPEVWRPVGSLDDFPLHQTKLVKFKNADPQAWAGISAHSAAWLRRESAEAFRAFSANCTHLGCPVRWEADAQLFMCPCHGGVYYKDGSVAAGPPPKALTQYQVRVVKGQVQVKTAPVPITTIQA